VGPPEGRFVKDRTHQEILKVVDERVDLVVTGVQGKGLVDRLVVGSTTHRVIREAGRPNLPLPRRQRWRAVVRSIARGPWNFRW
jgi:nucleotide-binding universal stress UspA family protein